jgi:hypothetical protein
LTVIIMALIIVVALTVIVAIIVTPVFATALLVGCGRVVA